MELPVKRLDFAGQKFFVGIDVHKKNWKITVRSQGLSLKTFSMNPSPSELYKHLTTTYPNGKYISVYEAGFCGFWIHRSLTACGITNIVINPADVPTTHKEKDRKTDAIDSNKLCRELENCSLKGLYIPEQSHEAVRSLSRLWYQTTRLQTQQKNRIKSFLDFKGIKLPEPYATTGSWAQPFLMMLSKLSFAESSDSFVFNEYLANLSYIRSNRLKYLRQIRKVVKDIPTVRLLQTIPGVGAVVSFILYCEIVDMHRFKKLDHLLSFVGLVPSVSSSDTTMIVRGITNRHNRYLRYALIETAWVAIREDPALLVAFSELCKRMSKSAAIVRIAKKLTNRIRAVWLKQQEYVKGTLE